MRWLVAAAVILLISVALAPPAAADHDSLHIVLLVEDREYSIGSSCRVTVRAFERMDPTDIDNVPEVRVGLLASRTVLMQRVATGEYRGTFQIEQMDVLNGFMLIQAQATKGRTAPESTVYDADSDAVSMHVSSSSGGSVQVLVYATAISTSVIGPGTEVTLRAETILLGAPVEPSSLSLKASYYDRDGTGHDQALAATNISTGVFEANYTFPQAGHDIDVTFSANARYINDTAIRTMSLRSSVFFVLFHSLARSSNESAFEFFVADAAGRPVAGASGDLTWWTDNQPQGQWKRRDLGTTDVKGRLAGALAYDNGTRLVHMRGYFNASGQSQAFFGVLEIPGAVGAFAPDGQGFQVVHTKTDRPYEPGRRLVREYAVFNNSTPMASANVDVFVTASPFRPDGQFSMAADAMVFNGQARTDGRGRFNLSIDAPVNGSYLFFAFRAVTGAHPKQSEAGHYSTDGNYYSEATDLVVAAEPFAGKEVTVSASTLKIGEPLDVRASMRSGAQAHIAYACWIPGKFEPYTPAGSGGSDWQMWSAVFTYLNRSGGGFSARISIPSFMPSGIGYSMVVFAVGRNSTQPYYGVASLTAPQGVRAPPTVPMIYIVAAAVIIAAVAGGAAYAVRRGRRRAAAGPAVQARASAGQAAPAMAAPAFTIEKAVNCPDCGTAFIVQLGPAPTKIRCPRCGKTGTHPAVTPAQAQAPAAGVLGAGGRGPWAGSTTGPPSSMSVSQYPAPGSRFPAPAVQARTMSCPRCRQQFTIERREGPQQIRCPHCGKEGTIGRKSAPAAPPAEAPVAPPAPVPAPERMPQDYSRQARPPPAAAPQPVSQYPTRDVRYPTPDTRPPTPASFAPAPGTRLPAPARLVTCPHCRTRFGVEDPRRPLSVRCPGCGREGVLRK